MVCTGNQHPLYMLVISPVVDRNGIYQLLSPVADMGSIYWELSSVQYKISTLRNIQQEWYLLSLYIQAVSRACVCTTGVSTRGVYNTTTGIYYRCMYNRYILYLMSFYIHGTTPVMYTMVVDIGCISRYHILR